jgi:hypothetical protein
MKTFIKLIFISSILLSFGCSEKKEDPKPVTPTSLRINVKDGVGNNVSGATVKLYTSKTNFENQTNQVGATVVTDANGNATLSDLNAIQYYWFIEKDCKNNFNGGITSTNPLSANTINNITIILSETGTLTYQNNSSNPYRVFLNGNQLFDMPGNTSRMVRYVPTGSFTVRALQLSGFLVVATDISAVSTISCGDSQTFQFP